MSREIKSRQLFREIGNIDDRYLVENEAESKRIPQKPAKSMHHFRWIMAAASSLAIIVAAGILWNGFHPAQDDSSMKKEAAQIANPYIECKTLEDASKIAGFTISVPDTYEGASQFLIQAIKNNMIEVIYHDTADTEIFRIRKGLGTDEISGDYTEYKQITTKKSGDWTITLKGENDVFSVAVWSDKSYQYAISMQDHPMSWDKIEKLVEQIH